jgi:hypothetical protein
MPVGILVDHTLTMIAHLKNNYVAGIKTSPLRSLKFSLVATLIYGLIAAIVGLNAGLFKVQLIDLSFAWFLPLKRIEVCAGDGAHKFSVVCCVASAQCTHDQQRRPGTIFKSLFSF